MLQMTDLTCQNALIALLDTGGALDTASLFAGLFTAIDDHGGATVLADLTQATGAMATRVAEDPRGAVHKLTDGRWAADLPPATFAPANSGEAQTVIGWFLADANVAGVLLMYNRFPTPINCPDEFHPVTVIPRITMDPRGKWGAEIVYNG
jgi:hypothetical protein